MGADCPLCGVEAAPKWRTRDLNQRRSDRVFTYCECASCRLVFLADPPEDLGAYYPPSYHTFPTRARLEQMARHSAHRVRYLQQVIPNGRLLEVGPGTGAFALAAAQAGFSVETIERSAEACEFLERVARVQATRSEWPSKSIVGPHDAIAFWHVVEHLPDVWETLTRAASALRPNGVLLVATPDPTSLQAKAFGPNWWHVDAPRHLQLVPRTTLDIEMRKRGMTRVRSTTRDLDGLRWNFQGWRHSMTHAFAGAARLAPLGRALGAVASLAALPVESLAQRGSTYTAIYQKVSP